MDNKLSKSVEIVSPAELYAVLREFNPWWSGRRAADLPKWRRAAFRPLLEWLRNPPAKRAVLLAGARQVGKTTLLLQSAEQLIAGGVDPERVLYVTFDHPLFKLSGVETVLRAWREFQPAREGPEYLFLDEVQVLSNWQTWIKHQVDFQPHRRIVATGSALPIASAEQESGVGRWHTIKLPTLSFYEYLKIRNTSLPELPELSSLAQLFGWKDRMYSKAGEDARPLIPHFHEYLLRGGFPQTALVPNISTAQKLLREDIVDKVLKRDMTALFRVRRVLELEKMFIYLCMHDGGVLDMATLCGNLQASKQTVGSFLELLEACNLIFKLPPFGYGKEILRARYKVYLADAAIPGSVLLRGASLLEDPAKLGAAVETAFFKHVFTHYSMSSVGFSYWRGKNDQEVDIVAEFGGNLVPFEVKYSQREIGAKDLKGLSQLVQERGVDRAYVITQRMEDFGPMSLESRGSKRTPPPPARVMRVPAALACFWLSRLEVSGTSRDGDVQQ